MSANGKSRPLMESEIKAAQDESVSVLDASSEN